MTEQRQPDGYAVLPPKKGPIIVDRAARRSDWGWFAAWLVIGGGYALGTLSLLTIGLFVLLISALLTVVLLVLARRCGVRGLPGLVSGPGVLLLYVAYLNRSGPGNVCQTLRHGGQHCTDEWSPWPWAVGGLLLLSAGVVSFLLGSRRRT
ncbi:MAG: hypothetical protein QOI74_700 [Micromonosporaceae bacterium]|jgi:hypothetical protein|nr:hypothetical protein [Micromonosporaceae bacterium]